MWVRTWVFDAFFCDTTGRGSRHCRTASEENPNACPRCLGNAAATGPPLTQHAPSHFVFVPYYRLRRQTLRILQWNAHDLSIKQHDLRLRLKVNRIDICLIQEVKFLPKDTRHYPSWGSVLHSVEYRAHLLKLQFFYYIFDVTIRFAGPFAWWLRDLWSPLRLHHSTRRSSIPTATPTIHWRLATRCAGDVEGGKLRERRLPRQ